MAVKEPNVLIELDGVEIHINASFHLLNECLNKRRIELLSQYRDRRDERRAAVESRKEMLQQLSESKLDLQGKMKNNELHSMLEKMMDDVDAKMKLLELEDANENNEKLLFEYDVKDLEKKISQFGKICENSSQQASSHGETPQTVGLSHMHKDNWEIERSSMQLVKKLGVGQFTEVWLAVWNDSSLVAVKTMHPGTMSREDFLAEATIMKKLQHKNVVKLIGVCTIREPIYIVIEYMAKRSLLEFLKRGYGAKMDQQELVKIGAQVAAGMAHLEMHHYIHMDLRAMNVLVGDANQIKVADFAMARVIDEEGIYEPEVGTKFTIRWTAPEAALYNRFSIKSDVWSFGVLLMEIITLGGAPYPGMTNREVLDEATPPRNYRMPKPQNCPGYLYQIMLDCWNANADARPTFENLKYQLEDFYVATEMRYKDLNQ